MQPSMFPLPFDAQGNLILTGIHAPNGAWSIDSAGNASFQSLDVTGVLTEQGVDLLDMLNQAPLGTIAYVNFQSGTNTGNIGTTETIAFQGVVGQLFANRFYRFSLKGHIQYSTTAVAVDIRIRYTTDGTTPTTSSNILRTVRVSSANTSQDLDLFKYYSPASDYDNWKFCITMQVANAGTTDWYMGAADRSLEFAVDDLGIKANVGAINFTQVSGASSGGGVNTYTKTYSANGSQSYQSDGSQNTVDNGHCFQGYYSGTNGNQFSLITFPYTTIQSDLSGATVTKVQLYLNNLHWYNNSGGTAIIGTHTYSSIPGTANYANVNPDITEAGFSYSQAKWVTVANSIGNALRDNTAKGIALGKGPSTSHTYYGYFAGNGQSGEPQLKITYTK